MIAIARNVSRLELLLGIWVGPAEVEVAIGAGGKGLGGIMADEAC